MSLSLAGPAPTLQLGWGSRLLCQPILSCSIANPTPFPVWPSPLFLSVRRPRPRLSCHSATRARPAVQKETPRNRVWVLAPLRVLGCHGGICCSDPRLAAAAGSERPRTLGLRGSTAPQHRADAHGRCEWGRAAGGHGRCRAATQRWRGGPREAQTPISPLSLTVSAVGGRHSGRLFSPFLPSRGKYLASLSPHKVALPSVPTSSLGLWGILTKVGHGRAER